MHEILSPIYAIMYETNQIIYHLGSFVGFSTGLILILCGVLLAFWGYKLKKITLIIVGFLIGASLGIFIAEIANINNTGLFIVLIIFLGIICGFLSFFLYFASVIIIGIFAGCMLGGFIGILLEATTKITIILSIIFSIIIGLLSVKINKIMFIIITSYLGYLLFRMSIYSLNIFGINKIVEELIAIVILIAGLVFQFIDNSDRVIDRKNTSKIY